MGAALHAFGLRNRNFATRLDRAQSGRVVSFCSALACRDLLSYHKDCCRLPTPHKSGLGDSTLTSGFLFSLPSLAPCRSQAPAQARDPAPAGRRPRYPVGRRQTASSKVSSPSPSPPRSSLTLPSAVDGYVQREREQRRQAMCVGDSSRPTGSLMHVQRRTGRGLAGARERDQLLSRVCGHVHLYVA